MRWVSWWFASQNLAGLATGATEIPDIGDNAGGWHVNIDRWYDDYYQFTFGRWREDGSSEQEAPLPASPTWYRRILGRVLFF